MWMVKNGTDWDDHLIEFTMFESHAMKNTRDSIRAKLSSIRSWRAVGGVDDFTNVGGRCRQVWKCMRRDRKVNRKIPLSLGVVEWPHTNFLQCGPANTS